MTPKIRKDKEIKDISTYYINGKPYKFKYGGYSEDSKSVIILVLKEVRP
jgi:hypothetical protein